MLKLGGQGGSRRRGDQARVRRQSCLLKARDRLSGVYFTNTGPHWCLRNETAVCARETTRLFSNKETHLVEARDRKTFVLPEAILRASQRNIEMGGRGATIRVHKLSPFDLRKTYSRNIVQAQ